LLFHKYHQKLANDDITKEAVEAGGGAKGGMQRVAFQGI